MRISITLILTFLVTWGLLAQSPSIPTPSLEQQSNFQTLLKSLQDAQSTEQRAREQTELAMAKLQQEIFRTMATLKLSPDEYDPQLKDGKLTFAPKPKPSPTPRSTP